MRYLLAVLAVIVTTIIMPEVLQMGWYSITYYINVPTMLLLLLITIPVLASAGLLKDFTRAFRIAFEKVGDISHTELKRSLEAVELFMKTFLYSGIFITVFSFIIILRTLADPASLGPVISTAILGLIYGFAINIMLLPLKSIIKIKLLESMQD